MHDYNTSKECSNLVDWVSLWVSNAVSFPWMVFHEGLMQDYDEDSDKGYLKRKEKLRQTHTSSEADTRSQGNQVQSRYMDKSSH